MLQVLRSSAEKDWEWIDIFDPTEAELREIAGKYGLHPSWVKDSLQPEHLPKYELIGDIVFIITRMYDDKAKAAASTIQELTHKIAIFFSDKFLITIHRNRQHLISEIKAEYVDSNRITSGFGLLLKIIRACMRTYEGPAQQLANDLANFEKQIFLHQHSRPLTKGLYLLKRKGAVSKMVLQLSEIILTNLRHHEGYSPEIQDLDDYYLRVSIIYDEINASTNNLMNIYISLSSQRTNEVMQVLTIISVFFMPLTYLAGIYGMNFEYMPELKMKLGYPATLAGMLFVAAATYFWFRKKGWL